MKDSLKMERNTVKVDNMTSMRKFIPMKACSTMMSSMDMAD